MRAAESTLPGSAVLLRVRRRPSVGALTARAALDAMERYDLGLFVVRSFGERCWYARRTVLVDGLIAGQEGPRAPTPEDAVAEWLKGFAS